MNSSTVTAASTATAAQYNNLRKDLVLAGGDFATSGGSANAQTLSLDAQIVTSYTTGMLVKFKAGFTNTGATTININTIGANTIKRVDGSSLKPSDIKSGATVILLFDGTNFMLINPTPRGGGELGDGSDGACALDGTNTYASLMSKSGGTYTALRDLFLTDLTLSNSSILDMAGYKLYGTGILSGTGTVRNNGQNGTGGENSNTSDGGTRGEGGTAGAAGLGITVPRAAASGNGGKSDYDTGADPGVAGTNATIAYASTSGSSGGAGGSGGAAGGGGTVTTVSAWRPNAIPSMCSWFHFAGTTLTVIQVAPGSGGGGGGGIPGGAGSNSGGGGGGAGGVGGFLFVMFHTIAASVAFEAKGGNGGNGGNGVSGLAPRGGGGGGGGNGGIIMLAYVVASGYTTSVIGGTKGNGGSGAGTAGSNGVDGSAGTVITIPIA